MFVKLIEIFIYVICVKICHEAKLQTFVKGADDPQPSKSFPKQKDL